MNYMQQNTILHTLRVSLSIWLKAIVKTLPFSLINLLVVYLLLKLNLFNQLSSSKNILNNISLLVFIKFMLLTIIWSTCNVGIIYTIHKIACNEIVYFTSAINVGIKKSVSMLIVFTLTIVILIMLLTFLYFCILIFTSMYNGRLFQDKLILHLIFLLPFIICILAYVYFLLAPYILVVDNKSIIDSFIKSLCLVKKRWFYVFIIFLIRTTIIFLATYILFITETLQGARVILYFLANFFYTVLLMPFIDSLNINLLYSLLVGHSKS